eukprot:TRINITY_DN73847_c0_g1_i1.p1 TRINITY_DN73847_c0_g1~~TRINITY_DN73847_c0_g1_i1.p1  ORF type:complete len:525 (+),score=55.69 TRINITY_DN73847_c0_g1_i1:81-1655(+)
MPTLGLDDVFAYQTPKVVLIRDRYVGFIRVSLMAAIFCLIIIFEILYKGKHLVDEGGSGVYRLQLQQPTENGCNLKLDDCKQNFSSLSDLAYCQQSSRVYTAAKKPCRYFDGLDLSTDFDSGIAVTTNIEQLNQQRSCVPSKDNNWSCNDKLYVSLNADSNVTHHTSSIQDTFAADVGRFTLLIDHSFRGNGNAAEMSKDQFGMPGFWLRCRNTTCEKIPIVCGMSDVRMCPRGQPTLADVEKRLSWYLTTPSEAALLDSGEGRISTSSFGTFSESRETRSSRRHVAGDPEAVEIRDVGSIGMIQSHRIGATDRRHGRLKRSDSWSIRTQSKLVSEEARARKYAMDARLDVLDSPVISITNGDIFSIDQLLRIAGIDLDELVDGEAGSPRTYRSTGLVLVVLIEYTNQRNWIGLRTFPWHATPHPEYTISVTTAPSPRFKTRSAYTDQDDGKRVFIERNGIRIVVQQQARILVWSWTNFLVILTTSLGLLKVADMITEGLALYGMRNSKAYSDLKYERSIDFNP